MYEVTPDKDVFLSTQPRESIAQRRYIYLIDYREALYLFDMISQYEFNPKIHTEKYLRDIIVSVKKYCGEDMLTFQLGMSFRLPDSDSDSNNPFSCTDYTWAYGQKTTKRTKRYYDMHEYYNVQSDSPVCVAFHIIDSDCAQINSPYRNKLGDVELCRLHRGKKGVEHFLHHLNLLLQNGITNIPRHNTIYMEDEEE